MVRWIQRLSPVYTVQYFAAYGILISIMQQEYTN